MRKLLLLLFTLSFFSLASKAQSFSNKGKDFWVGYGNHVRMFNTGQAESMQIYLTSDINTSGTIAFTSGTASIPFNITANQITVVQIPRSEFLNDEGLYSRGIHITALSPIVAYGFIYVNAISGATLFLPTNTLGKEYYSLNYRQLSNENNSYSYFFVEAVEPGTTTVEITPTQTTKNGWVANTPQTVNLTQGQIYQVLSLNDLTGSKIKSIAPPNGACKKIAVFCGSGKISIGCSSLSSPTTATGSSDNLYQQMYPYATWGKRYITVSSVNATSTNPNPNPNIPNTLNSNTNRFRILRPDATSVVTLNGVIIPSSNFTNNYYDFSSNATSLIDSDKPIMVAQYFTTAAGGTGCPSGNNNPHDPEMIYLNPVEQTISDVTLNSMQPTANTAISQHFINVVVKNGGTGISSFKIDGVNIPPAAFTVLPQDNSYSYARIWKQGGNTNTTATPLSLGVHRLISDSSFNAIVYGFGSAESYGYSAGANLKDLTNAIAIQNNLSILPITDAIACTNSPFSLKLYLQDSALTNTGPFAGQAIPVRYDSMKWSVTPIGVTFNGGQTFPYTVTPVNQAAISGIPASNFLPHYSNLVVRPDSTSVVNGKTVKWYFFPYSLNSLIPGPYSVKVTGYLTNSVADCGSSTNEKDYEFPLIVSPPPSADFVFTQPGCPNDVVTFTETTPQTPYATYAFYWNFGESSSPSNISGFRNPTHSYSNPSTNLTTDYIVKHASINAAGCISDTITKIVNVPNLPTATITGSNTVCINTASPSITFTGSQGLPPYVFSYHINSGPIQTVTSTGATATVPVNTSVAGTFTYYLDSVKNQLSAVCNQPQTGNVIVNITPDATIALSSAAGTDNQTLCINTALTNITYAVGGSGTGGSVSGLPAGVTGTYAGGVITISGTPTVSGTFSYTVSTTGPCFTPQATGTITVTADATLALTSAAATTSQTLCINNAITNITYSVGGSGTGGSVSGLPTGVTGSYASGVITISGTPTVSGTFNYTVNTTGPCVKPSATGTITVTADATLALTSAVATTSQTLCINNVLNNITYAVGGSGIGGSVSGLPAGVTGTYAGGVITISGTPTVSGTFSYTVSTTGPCVTPQATGTITVTADATLALTSAAATTSQTLCINNAITNITYAVGGSGTGGSVSGLPTGVTGTYAGGVITITGTPTVSGTFNYTVNTTGPCVKPSATGVINVTADATLALSSAPATNNQNLCINVPITNITYSVGGSGTGGSVSGLPTGVTGSFAGGVITISGTPSVIGTFNYTVSTTGPCIKPQATGLITVTPDATITLTTATATTAQQLCKNKPLTNITYQVAGGGTGAIVSGLPSGVTGIFAGGIFTISGTPTIDGLFNYTVTTTGTCVQKTATGSILVHPLPTASYAITAPFCAEKAITFTPTFGITPTGSVTSWVWDYGDGTGVHIRPDGNPFTITYPTAGVKPVSFKVISDMGCESNLITTPAVIVNSKPKAGFKNPESCLADSYADFSDTSTVAGVGASIVYWEWDFGDGTPIYAGSTTGPVNTHQNPRHAYLAVGQKTVKLIVTTNSGCKDTITQTFFINGEVTSADFISQNGGNFCSNRPVQIKENSVVNVGGLIRVDIYWDNVGAPTVFELDDVPTPGKIYTHSYPNLQTDVTYKVRYIAYSGFNGVCQKEIIKDVIVHAAPVASFAPPINVCLNGGPIQLTGSEIGGVGGTSVYMGTGVSPTGLFNPLTAGAGSNNNITYTAISPNNCDSALVRPIHVLLPPVAAFTTVGNLCVGPTNLVTFHQTSTSTEGGAIVKWIYDWGDGSAVQTFTSGADVTHAYNTAGTYTAHLIVETAFGCRNAAPGTALTFTVNPLPVPSYTFTSSACLPNANIVFTNTTANLAGNTYDWSFALPSTLAADVSTATNPSHVYTNLGPHNTHLIATNIVTGCKDSTAIIPVNTIHPAPVVVFATVPNVCLNNGTVQLTQGSETSGIAGGPGVYSGPGVSASGVFNPITAGVGTHTLTYTFTSTFNCPASVTQTVKVLAPPVVNTFTTLGNRCEQNATTFHNTTTSTEGVVATWVYNWGDGSPLQSVNNGNDITHVYAIAGTYTATLSLITDYGCNSTTPFPVTVVINPIPRPNFTYSDTACLPVASILFKNTTPNINNWAYTWNFDVPSNLPADISTQQSNITHLYYTQAPHTVRLIAVSGTTGCTDSIFKPIVTIHPAPVANFNFTKPFVCIRDAVGVTDASTPADGVNIKWEWNWGDLSTALGQNPAQHTYLTAGDFSVKLKVTNNWGCVDDSTKIFTVHPYPFVNAGVDSIILLGGNLTLTPIVSGNDLTYLWTGTPAPINLSSTIVKNPVASPIEDITYKLTVTGRGNCSASDFVFIKVLKAPVIPNTFTPNNDGVHDTWIIQYLESYPENRVQVFTRTGQLVFESKRYLKPWDGTLNGKSLPIDTYYYVIEPGSGRAPMTGFVTILK